MVRVDPIVEAVQRELALAGYYTGPVDGLPGRRTKTSIAAYQKANALDVDRRRDARNSSIT